MWSWTSEFCKGEILRWEMKGLHPWVRGWRTNLFIEKTNKVHREASLLKKGGAVFYQKRCKTNVQFTFPELSYQPGINHSCQVLNWPARRLEGQTPPPSRPAGCCCCLPCNYRRKCTRVVNVNLILIGFGLRNAMRRFLKLSLGRHTEPILH